MTTIIVGMTPAQFITALNNNFCSVGDIITDILTGAELNTAINNNFNIIDGALSITTTDVAIGMTGSSYISTLNLNYTKYYDIPKAIGTKTGTTAQIYATTQAIIDSDPVTTKVPFLPSFSNLDPTGNYLSTGWADFPNVESTHHIPLLVKYGFSSSFYMPIYPKNNDWLNDYYYNLDNLKNVEKSGCKLGNHSLINHLPYFTCFPLYDGRNVPSKDDLRIARADGTNELGSTVTDTVDTSLGGTAFRQAWLVPLSNTLGAKKWEDLLDQDCLDIAASLSVFARPNGLTIATKVLEALDYLSNRYCGTTGYSVLNGDYVTRTPNTVGGVEPDNLHRIQGGIFQGAATTCNHEIWERALIINEEYKKESCGLNNDLLFCSTAGGFNPRLSYTIENQRLDDCGHFQDRLHTKLLIGSATHLSSITGEQRSWIDVQRDFGILTGMNTQGEEGYGEFSMNLTGKLEGQRTTKKNGLKKPENVGDGYNFALRLFDSSIPLIDQQTLLTAVDLVKDLYDYTFTDARYTGILFNGMPSKFCVVIDNLVKFNAWGIVPDANDDSGGTGTTLSSFMLVLEAYYQFCLRTGITIISREEAVVMGMTKSLPAGYNYFPNNTFATTVATITASVNAPVYPDGWDGGVVLSEDTGAGATNVVHKDTNGTIFTRQYAIKPGTFALSFKAKGVGTLKVRKILNKNNYINTVGTFTEINSITINSPLGYAQYTDSVVIPDAALETYAAPTTPTEEAYQNYMKGYGDKICGIQIELVIAGGNYVKMGNCSLIEI